MAMDFARENQLIHTIDHDVQRLLTHVDELGSAGDARPLLTAIGQTLKQHLHQAAEVIGALAALLPEASAGAPRIERKSASRALTPRAEIDVALDAGAPAAAVPADGTSGSAANVAPAVPALRRRRRRSRIHRGTAAASGPADGAHDTARAVGSPDQSERLPADPTPATPPTPVYRLRKAGTKGSEPQPGPAVRERDELRRLSDFLQAPTAEHPELASAS